MLRLLLLGIMMLIYGILMLPFFLLRLIIKDGWNHFVHRVVQTTLRWAAKLFFILSGIHVNITGQENVIDKPCLYISNHTGIFDVGIAYVYVKPLFAFIGKNQAEKYPIIGQTMWAMNGLFLNRDDLKQGLQVILKAIDHIKNGIGVWICPEGTREKTGGPADLLPFHAGSFKIATKTGCPIVPVTIVGTRALFEDHKPFISGGTVTVQIGKPIDPAELSEDERRHIADYFRDLMIKMIENTPEETAR